MGFGLASWSSRPRASGTNAPDATMESTGTRPRLLAVAWLRSAVAQAGACVVRAGVVAGR